MICFEEPGIFLKNQLRSLVFLRNNSYYMYTFKILEFILGVYLTFPSKYCFLVNSLEQYKQIEKISMGCT